MVIKIALVMVRGVNVNFRKCKQCGQHNSNLYDDTCFECREYEYQMNLGE